MRAAVGYRWRLRRVMADRGLFQTTELVPLLAERGVRLSREQVYRLASGVPQRLNLTVLAALCDILECEPGDLIECYSGDHTGGSDAVTPSEKPRPRRARVSRGPESRD